MGSKGEANLSLERLLGGSLAHGDGVLVVGHVEELVRLGVPLGGVHAVDDALDAAGGVDDGVELDTLGRGARDLLGVVHGHGDVAVRVDERRLHPVVLAELLAGGGGVALAVALGVALVVHLALGVLEEEVVGRRFGEAELAHGAGPEAALERDVVHGERALGVEVLALGAVHLVDHHGHEAGVPVVGDEAHVLAVAEGKHHGSLERSLAEHGEALLVVRKVGAVGLAVQLRAGLTPHLGEEERVVDEDAVDALLVLVEVANLLASASTWTEVSHAPLY